MRCFYHPDREAVGLCKNCAKGLCAESAIDVGDGLACAGPCEKRVERMNALMDKSHAMASTSSSFIGSGMLALAAALAGFGIFAWLAWGDSAFGVWLVVLGAIFAATPTRQLFRTRLRGS
jgi:hypothetical protein